MKTLLGIFLLLPLFAFPQFNYKKMSVSLGGGAAVPHMDVTDFSFEPVINGAFHYNITPYAAVGIDAEFGKLTGNYENSLEFENKFLTVAVDARLQAGQFTGRNVSGFGAVLSKLYAGAGLGIIHSDVVSGPPGSIGEVEELPGAPEKPASKLYKSSDVIVPVFAGANIPLMKELDLEILTLFINYRLNISFSDELDALATSASTSNDFFSTLSVGLRLNFGPKGPYFTGAYR